MTWRYALTHNLSVNYYFLVLNTDIGKMWEPLRPDDGELDVNNVNAFDVDTFWGYVDKCNVLINNPAGSPRHERLIVIYITADKDVISVWILKIEYTVMAVNQQFTSGLSFIAR